MTELVVLAYADEHRAAEVLAALRRLRTGTLIDPEDVVSVARATDWGMTLQFAVDLRADEVRTHQLWRTLITSLLLAPGGASTPIRPAALGLDADFVRGVEAALPLGSSAVFLLAPRTAVTRVLLELERFGGLLLRTPIDRAAVTQLVLPPSSKPGHVTIAGVLPSDGATPRA